MHWGAAVRERETVPYIVLPYSIPHSRRVANLRNGKTSDAIYADLGPRNKIGEGSIALARALGINPDPRRGGQDNDVLFVVYSVRDML